MSQTLLAVESLDDRRELLVLLDKLSPRRRVAFLEWCCRLCTRPNRSAPVVMPAPELVRDAERCDRGSDRLTNSVYLDIVSLGVQWALDMPRAAAALEGFVRRGAPPQIGAGHPRARRPGG